MSDYRTQASDYQPATIDYDRYPLQVVASSGCGKLQQVAVVLGFLLVIPPQYEHEKNALFRRGKLSHDKILL